MGTALSSDTRGSGEWLKDSPVRSVLRWSPEAGQPRVVKIYRSRGIWGRLRFALGRSPADRERSMLERLAKAGIACPTPLEGPRRFTERGEPAEVLVLEDLGPGMPVGAAIEMLDPERAVALGERVAVLIERLFAAGIRHPDLHLGNLYLTDGGELCCLDLHAARCGAPTRPTPARLLALRRSVPWPEHEPFRNTLFARLGIEIPPAQALRDLRRHLARRLDRAFRDSGSFVRGTEPDGRPWLMRRGEVRTPEAWRREIESGVVVKSGRRGRVVRFGRYFAKRRDPAHATELWRAAEALALRRIPHARAIALVPASSRSAYWMVSEAVEGSPAPFSPAAALEAVSGFARALGRLHATSWRCRDGRADNLVLAEGAAVLVDLDGIRPGRRGWERDLARAFAWLEWQSEWAAAERNALLRRFWRAYLSERAALGDPVADRRRLRERIARHAERWRGRHR